MLFFVAMSLSPGAHPKRKSKKVLDPDFQCDFPSSAFLQGDLNLEEQSNPATYNRSTKQSTQSSKLKSAMVLAASSSPIATDDTASSALSFDQQLQPLKHQKDKLELELKVLTLSTAGMPSTSTITSLHIPLSLHTTSLPADVLWGSFVTHSFLPHGRLLNTADIYVHQSQTVYGFL